MAAVRPETASLPLKKDRVKHLYLAAPPADTFIYTGRDVLAVLESAIV
jgi:hypothetical protein